MKLFSFLAGFFQDQKGNSSSKRIVMYWSMGLLTYMVAKGFPLQMSNGTVTNASNMEMFYSIAAMVLTFGGYAVSEYFKKPDNIQSVDQSTPQSIDQPAKTQ